MKRVADRAAGALGGQLLRYVITGAGLAALYATMYWTAAVPLGLHAQLANVLGFLAALLTGYTVHSRWSFRGHGRRDSILQSRFRFLAVNLAGYLLNCLWVWIVTWIGFSPSHAIMPIVLATPGLTFWLNRRWTFA